jgi:sortase A
MYDQFPNEPGWKWLHMTTQNRKRNARWLVVALYLAGITLFMAPLQIQAETGQRDQTPSYQIWIQDPYTNESSLATVSVPDYSLWNATRITDYEDSLLSNMAPPLAILTIDRMNLQVPIWNGTDDLVLNRGAGRIKGTAKMDEVGNLGLSGHRDGFFRGFKDIQMGDEIEVQTTKGVQTYEVSSITIVPKADISPLAPSDEKIITFVTCYPFYFVGHAPKRYIVIASAK